MVYILLITHLPIQNLVIYIDVTQYLKHIYLLIFKLYYNGLTCRKKSLILCEIC